MTADGLSRPDDVYQALMDAQDGLDPTDAERFRARLILVLLDRVGDDGVALDAIASARATAGRGAAS